MGQPMREAPLRLPDIEASDRLAVPRNISQHLRALILRGGLKPGDRLPSQRELASQLGVSRPSVREALAELEAMGLVTIRVGSGVFVASADQRAPLWRFSDRCSPRDVYEARYGLESYAAGMAARHVDEEGARRLKACVDAMREAFLRDDVGSMAAADADFHDLVFELAGNPVLAGMYRPVRDLMVETQRLPMTLRTRLNETLREHEALLACLVAGDVAGSARAMQDHIREAARRFGIELSR